MPHACPTPRPWQHRHLKPLAPAARSTLTRCWRSCSRMPRTPHPGHLANYVWLGELRPLVTANLHLDWSAAAAPVLAQAKNARIFRARAGTATAPAPAAAPCSNSGGRTATTRHCRRRRPGLSLRASGDRMHGRQRWVIRYAAAARRGEPRTLQTGWSRDSVRHLRGPGGLAPRLYIRAGFPWRHGIARVARALLRALPRTTTARLRRSPDARLIAPLGAARWSNGLPEITHFRLAGRVRAPREIRPASFPLWPASSCILAGRAPTWKVFFRENRAPRYAGAQPTRAILARTLDDIDFVRCVQRKTRQTS